MILLDERRGAMERGMKELTGHCNGCANRCPLNSMQCGRGLKLMGLDRQVEQQVIKRQQEAQASLAGLLKACNNKLFISGGKEEFFEVLSEEERERLKEYLDRLVNR